MTSLLEELRQGEVLVTFEKRDGTIRDMRCTLNSDLIPANKAPLNTLSVKTDQVRVFDLDLGEWRSFNMSNLMYFMLLSKTE